MKLEEIDSVHIPIPINFIFVGFNGEGNQGNATISFCLMMTFQIEVLPCVLKALPDIFRFYTTGRKGGNLIDLLSHVRFS